MKRITYYAVVLTILMATCVAEMSFADGCERCRANATCRKVCHLVCEDEKIEITCWDCKSEDFCVPGPSKRDCTNCESACEICADGQELKSPGKASAKFVWTNWIPGPGRAKVYTRKKLMKRTTVKTIPSHKWVVEDLCEKCESRMPPVSVKPGTAVPPLPAFGPDVKVQKPDAKAP